MNRFKDLTQDVAMQEGYHFPVYLNTYPVFDYKSKGTDVYLITNPEVDLPPISFEELEQYIVDTQLPFELVRLLDEYTEKEVKGNISGTKVDIRTNG